MRSQAGPGREVLKRFALDAFTPDQPLGLNAMSNAWALPEGYRPAKAFSAIAPILAGFLNGCAYVGSDGTTALLAGTATNLYRYSGTAWTSVLGSLTASSWRFDQFGDNVIGAKGGTPVKFDLIGGTAATLGGSPPDADMVATVRQQVFLAGDPSALNTVYISGYNDSEGWTPGTNQSLAVPFPNGGDIMGLCGGDTGLILQKRSIKRATYTGDVTVWQFDEISHDVGCMAKGSVVQAGYLVFFLSEQGFKVCDRNEVRGIGSEKLDRWFFSSYSRSDIANISAAIDPRTTTVLWAMPGTPGRIIAYNWTLDKWSVLSVSLRSVFSGFTANISIDALDGLYPGGIDTIPYSLDAAIFAGGNPLFIVCDATGVLGTLSGDNMAAQFTLAPVEVDPGYRVRIRGARLVGDVTSGTVSIDARARAGDPSYIVVSGAIRDNGRVPLRANGRHIGQVIDIPAGDNWSYILGVDLEYERSGAR